MELINTLVSCGNLPDFDPILPNITSTIITAIKIFIPVVLVFLGMLDMGKAVMSGDEKVVKENQTKLIKRFVYAIVIFLLVSIVQLVFSMIDKSGDGENKSVSCITCFVGGSEKCGK